MTSRLPSFPTPYKYAVISAASQDYYSNAIKETYGEDTEVRERDIYRVNAEKKNPAWANVYFNIWHLGVINDGNLMVKDRFGIMQTPGHEFFHIFQFNATSCGKCANSEKQIPEWFIEGPAMFMGLNTARYLKQADWWVDLRPTMVTRFQRNSVTRALPLKEVDQNDRVEDPYAIGFAATEFLVSKIGMDRFLDIYLDLGAGSSLDQSFRDNAGVGLDDFYAAFENARAAMDFPRS